MSEFLIQEISKSYMEARLSPALSQPPVHWRSVKLRSPIEAVPRQRSLHAGTVVGESMYLFGGYDGSVRLNDLHRFDFFSSLWTLITPLNGLAPSPRDRFAMASHAASSSFYIFGGYDGTNRVRELWRFDCLRNCWHLVDNSAGSPPSQRHSHSMVEWENKLFVLFGYDGNYRSDIFEFNISRNTWICIQPQGFAPRPRYRSSVVAYKDSLIVFGGHDGSKHLDDLLVFNLKTYVWSLIEPVVPMTTMGPYAYRTLSPLSSASHPPASRDSHSAVVHGESMFIFGGSSGAARNDFFEYRIDVNAWIELQPNVDSTNLEGETDCEGAPNPRFCHVAVLYKDCMYIHAGYDGQTRLSDFRSYSFVENVLLDLPPPTILEDLGKFVNDPVYADIVFEVDSGDEFFGHKIILSRCAYFKAMFESNMAEKTQTRIRIKDVTNEVFQLLLSYLYLDEITIETSSSDLMALFVAADRFGIERLKRICEQAILSTLTVENACVIFRAADMSSASLLRKKSVEFILRNYDAVLKTIAFEELARSNIELTLELIRNR